jgi:hypothetical protein
MPPLPVNAPSLTDTSPGSDHPTVAGSGRPHGYAGGESGARLGTKRVLPVAQPLDEESPSEFVLDTDSQPLSFWRQQGLLKDKDLGAYLARRRGTSRWLWVLVATGALLAVGVMIAVWILA